MKSAVPSPADFYFLPSRKRSGRGGANSVTAWLASTEWNGIIIGIGWKTFGIWPAMAGNDAE